MLRKFSFFFSILSLCFIPQYSLAQASDEMDPNIMSVDEQYNEDQRTKTQEEYAQDVSKATTKEECLERKQRVQTQCDADLAKIENPTSDQKAKCVNEPEKVYTDCMETAPPDTGGNAREEEFDADALKAKVRPLNQFQGLTAQKVIGNIMATAMKVMGSIAFAMMVFAGFLWMTAAGNSDRERKARDIMVWSALGVIVILSSYSLVKLVFDAFA